MKRTIALSMSLLVISGSALANIPVQQVPEPSITGLIIAGVLAAFFAGGRCK